MKASLIICVYCTPAPEPLLGKCQPIYCLMRIPPQVFLDVAIDDKPIGRIEIVLFMKDSPLAAENLRVFCTGGFTMVGSHAQTFPAKQGKWVKSLSQSNCKANLHPDCMAR